MADTKRTITDLLTNLFQDGQAAGSITAQDLRDLIVSLGQRPHGSCYMTGNVTTTTIGVAGTFYKAAGTTSPGADSSDVDVTTTNRLKYTGTLDQHFFISASVSVSIATNNVVAGIQIAKNGVVIGTQMKETIVGSGDFAAMSIHTDTTLSTNDYVELWVTNYTGTTAVLVEDMVLSMQPAQQ